MTKSCRLPLFLVPLIFAVLMSACAVGSSPNSKPSALTEGVHTYKFSHTAPTVCRYNCLDVSSTYTGSWVNNRPKGQGQIVNSLGLTCRGEFGIDPPRSSLTDPSVKDLYTLLSEGGDEKTAREFYTWAKGTVYFEGKPSYTGYFRNNLYFGESCMPFGDNVWESGISGATITGTLSVSLNRRKGTFITYMGTGPCTIKRKDGAVYKGSCDAPSDHKVSNSEIWLQSMEEVYARDAFVLATESGVFIEANGRQLSPIETKQRINRYQEYFAEARRAASAAALAERNRQIAQAQEEARQSKIDFQGFLAVAGAAVIGQATSGSNYSDSQRTALVDAYVKDRINAANSVQSNNFGQVAAGVQPSAPINSAKEPSSQQRPTELAKPNNSQSAASRCTGSQRMVGAETTSSSSELATETSYADAVRKAKIWVAERTVNGNGSANGRISDIKTIECTALGGNPLYRRCLIEVAYEYDCNR